MTVGTRVVMSWVEVQVISTVEPPTVLVSVTGQREVMVLYSTAEAVLVTAGPVAVSEMTVGTTVVISWVEVQVTSTVEPPTVLVSVTGQSEVIVLYSMAEAVLVTAGPVAVSETTVGTTVVISWVEVQVTSTVEPPTVLVSVTGQSEVMVLYSTADAVLVTAGPVAVA